MPQSATPPTLQTQGFLTRLRRDRRGSTLSIVAASIFPLLAMVGGGIDVSRLYMARTRLQQACDAGALAGRRTMADPSTFTTADRAVAQRFFDFDFPAATYQANTVTRTYARGATPGTVTGSASIRMPTTVMKIFGFGEVRLAVECESTLVVPNTDIMFVLDVTGSMADTPAGDSQSKIASLRQAVKDFYVALGPGAATGPGRVRYGFVPYSSNVNVGKLVQAENAEWIAGGNGSENWTYQSRSPVTVTKYEPSYGAESARSGGASVDTPVVYPNGLVYTVESNISGLNAAQCSAKDADIDTGPIGSPTVSITTDENPPAYPDSTRDRTYTTVQQRGWRDYRAVYTPASGRTASNCQVSYRNGTFSRTTAGQSTTTPVTWTPYEEFQYWRYENRTIDVAPFVAGTAPNPAYWGGRYVGGNPNTWGSETTPSTIDWNGCIEEAATVDDITDASPLSRPSDAHDLDIDLIPDSIETRWKPYLPQLQYLRFGGYVDWYWSQSRRNNGFSACPREARRLAMYTSDVNTTTKLSAGFVSYVDSLQPIGGTYHDIGLIWGARFLSPDGIFAAANANSASPGAFSVDRHIVFMTDGALSTDNASPDPWGINFLDGRVAPTGSDVNRMNETHLRRTSIICEQMRGKGYTVWVVGFGISTMPAELQRCASDADHWSLAQNSAQLRTRFQQIAQLIGGLRLTQ